MIGKLSLAAFLATVVAASNASATIAPVSISVAPSPFTVNAPQDKSITHTIQVTNTSGAEISFGATTVGGTDAGDVALTADTCANHTIKAGKGCHVQVTITATEAVGTVETAELSFNDSSDNLLGTDSISATVTKGPLSVTASGDVVTIDNRTGTQISMDYSTFGNLSVTGGTCADYISPGKCTIIVSLTPPDNGDELEVQINDGHGNQYFDLFF